ncbi:MAG: LptA/OstA family protein [Campylobacterota bacterium]|nr:LptA/OstA family protein [Campylobacterota bacterium]
MRLNKIFKALFLILISTTIYAEENYLNIDATHFEADEKKNLMYFKGDVKMTKNKDVLNSQKLYINTKPSLSDPTKQEPKDYKAVGNVSFVLYTVDNVIRGKGDTVLYFPEKQKYIIIGNGYLEDEKDGKRITAEKIYIDEKTGHTKIDGQKNKPIKFRLKLNDTENEKK